MADISKITLPSNNTYDIKDATARSGLDDKVDIAGDTMTGNLVMPAGRIANTYYGISFERTTATPVETILYTGIKWDSSAHMPVVHITGYAYGLQSPVEFKIGFYIYNDKIGWCGVTNMGAWNPTVYLFKYTRDSVSYVAVGFSGSCYFLQLSADVQDEMGKFGHIDTSSSAWSWAFNTTAGSIPAADGGTTCIQVPYKADILKDTTYTAEKGITLSNGKFGHSNTAITAQTTQALYPIKIDAYGHITGYGSAVTVPAAVRVKGNAETSYRTGDVNLTPANIGAAASSHAHGNIQSGGTLQTTDVAIASGDKLVVTDSSDSNKVARTSLSFDGSTTTQFLSKKGTFETPSISVTITENTTFNISGTTFKINLVT